MSSLNAVETHMDSQLSDLNAKISNIDLSDAKLDSIRERRKLEIKRQKAELEKYTKLGHGSYTTVADVKEFFTICKKSPRVVIHFGRAMTKRCEIVDAHFGKLARVHMEAKFIKVDVEKCQYLAEKLQIVILPSIVIALEGKTEKTFRGFEEFGGFDDFGTHIIERRLKECGALNSIHFDETDTTLGGDDDKLFKKLGIEDSDEEENRNPVQQSKLSGEVDTDEEW